MYLNPTRSAMPHSAKTTDERSRPVRSIFISDLHLGSHFCRCEELTAFLSNHQPEYLYLVGDFIDGWALQRLWHWPESYQTLLERIVQLAQGGTRVYYTPGNHDDYLRQNMGWRHSMLIREEFVHRCVDGNRLLVIHGDQFDDIESKAQWLSRVGAKIYEAMLFGDRLAARLGESVGLAPKPLSHRVKRAVKSWVGRISGFERRLAAHAKRVDCCVAVCGHLHRPQDRMLGATRYINLGDWIENSSALVEHFDGRLELLICAVPESVEKREMATTKPMSTGGRIATLAEQLTAELLDDLPVNQTLDTLDRCPQTIQPVSPEVAAATAIATNQYRG
jgi:UDP-2,3-diacylglucosamine pyrophosphatase LpxH